MDDFARYLRLLDVPARPPSLAALGELVAAHVRRVPFENVGKLLHRADPAFRLPALGRFLDGVERHGLGGTCYANNHHLHVLLAHLGYDVRLCGADMSEPDVHLVNVVTLQGREYLVDAGYGAPFTAPLPLDAGADVAVEAGIDRYVLRPRDAVGRSRMDQFRGGQLRHGYEVNPAARRIEEFAGVIEASFAPGATFMNALRIIRFTPAGCVSLLNLALTESGPSGTRTWSLPGRDALPQAVERQFGIPAPLVRAAIAGVSLARDVVG